MATHLVTGAGSGHRYGGRRAAARRAATTWCCSPGAERADRARCPVPGATVLVADLADPEAVERSRQPARRLDSVLHTAGIVELGSGRRAPHRSLARAARRQPRLTCPADPACLPALRAARGIVVFVNSGAGLAARPQWSAYAASKFGLRALADSLRAEEMGTASASRRSSRRARRPRCRRRCTRRRAAPTTRRCGSVPRPLRPRCCTCSTSHATRRSPRSPSGPWCPGRRAERVTPGGFTRLTRTAAPAVALGEHGGVTRILPAVLGALALVVSVIVWAAAPASAATLRLWTLSESPSTTAGPCRHPGHRQ